jgi:hypothetical protein
VKQHASRFYADESWPEDAPLGELVSRI